MTKEFGSKGKAKQMILVHYREPTLFGLTENQILASWRERCWGFDQVIFSLAMQQNIHLANLQSRAFSSSRHKTTNF